MRVRRETLTAGRGRSVLTLLLVVALGWLGPGGTAASAAPPTPSFGPGVDSYADYVAQSTCDPVAKAGVLDFRALVLRSYPQTGDDGIVRACDIGGTSEHKEGRAWDWHVSANTQSATAADLLGWLLATDRYGNRNALLRRLGIMYIIWNGQIFGAYAAEEGWRPYPCGGSTGRDCHTTHVHFSFSWDGALRQTSWWTGVPLVTGKATGWRSLGGSILGAPDLTSQSAGSLDAVVRGSNRALYFRHRLPGGNWSAWVGLGGQLSGDPTVTSWGAGRLDVFGRGTDNALWHRAYSAGRGWSAWESLGGVLISGPDATSQATGQLDVLVVGSDRGLYLRSSGTSGWGPWRSLGGVVTADPAMTSWAPGRLDFFVRGADYALWHRYLAGGIWSGWEPLGGALQGGADAASSEAGHLEVVVTGGDSQVYRKRYASGSGWSPFERLSGVVHSAPAVAAPVERTVYYAARLDGGALGWRRSHTGSGSRPAVGVVPGD